MKITHFRIQLVVAACTLLWMPLWVFLANPELGLPMAITSVGMWVFASSVIYLFRKELSGVWWERNHRLVRVKADDELETANSFHAADPDAVTLRSFFMGQVHYTLLPTALVVSIVVLYAVPVDPVLISQNYTLLVAYLVIAFFGISPAIAAVFAWLASK